MYGLSQASATGDELAGLKYHIFMVFGCIKYSKLQYHVQFMRLISTRTGAVINCSELKFLAQTAVKVKLPLIKVESTKTPIVLQIAGRQSSLRSPHTPPETWNRKLASARHSTLFGSSGVRTHIPSWKGPGGLCKCASSRRHSTTEFPRCVMSQVTNLPSQAVDGAKAAADLVHHGPWSRRLILNADLGK